ncbi:synaptic vesicular amine transporter-like [Pectinophora gossypiella]|uniref:synaptic vesicular amine transporter-like n=1 Tax=Pectinophora gossypiella TaxID=13191 RepID=UPI00214E339A|nr:synaptic vesicular amine transporter-like [Pectinophora gossypiella]
MEDADPTGGLAAFALIYFTFFLDNVLLTVLVPIIPDWVRGADALALWSEQDAPLAALLNSTVHQITHQTHTGGVGRAQATVGAVLGAKAAAQLVAAAPAAGAVCRAGPARVLRGANLLLAAAALAFWLCSRSGGGVAALAVGGARALQGCGAALAAVAGLTLAAGLHHRALPALLGAVALGVLVGYPFGGLASAMWRPGTPFLVLAVAFVTNFSMYPPAESGAARVGVMALVREARRGPAGAAAGCVLLTTSVMAALEPCLPLWLSETVHAPRWQVGLAFLPDSAGYLLAASFLGSCARTHGHEPVAIIGQVVVGLSAMSLGVARSAWALVPPQFLLGAGLGAADAALVPALLAHAPHRRAAARSALLQAASSAAYALGPAAGGALAWAWGVPAAMAALGGANLLYAGWLYRRHPLQRQLDDDDEDSDDAAELAPMQYTPLR